MPAMSDSGSDAHTISSVFLFWYVFQVLLKEGYDILGKRSAVKRPF